MSTSIDLTFNCSSCNGDIAAPDIREHNSMQWRCPNCSEWSNWMKHTVEPNETITPQGKTYVSKYNVADMTGNIIPDEVMSGKATLDQWWDRAGKWDLRDNDGDYHSPSWYLAGFMSAHHAYLALHASFPQGATEEQEDTHMRLLDDALEECDEFDNYVNKLFGHYPAE